MKFLLRVNQSRFSRTSTMAILPSSNNLWLAFTILLLLFNHIHALRASPKSGKTEELQRLNNTTMAEQMEEVVVFNEHAVANPEEVVAMVHMSIQNSTQRRNLGYFSCGTGNPIDDCWRCDPHWHKNRKRLADCGIGFGRNAIGGKNGRFYVVTDHRDDDPVNPKPGTLRHAVIQEEPLWIIFKRDMVIELKEELIMNSFKTIDGRGANVHIANRACVTIQFVTNIIIHGIHIHDCKPTGNAMVRSSTTHYGWRTMADGDGISIFGASHIWIDHNSLSHCADGLVDAVMGSTAITISNNHFAHHNEVMLLGHSDSYVKDKAMQVTIAFNHFGTGLMQRMPRCRHGYFHVVNNDYTHWEMYAIGGSAAPTINSQGNRYAAPRNPFAKEVADLIRQDKALNDGEGSSNSMAWIGGALLTAGAFAYGVSKLLKHDDDDYRANAIQNYAFQRTKDYYILNFDGSDRNQLHKGGAGCIIRNKQGNLIIAASYNLNEFYPDNLHVAIAEAFAFRKGLELAKEKRIKLNLIKGDNREVMDRVLGDVKPAQVPFLNKIISEIKEALAEQFIDPWTQMEHINREANKVADELAEMGSKHELERKRIYTKDEHLTPTLYQLIQNDKTLNF